MRAVGPNGRFVVKNTVIPCAVSLYLAVIVLVYCGQ